jgi:hypothetical protein
MLRKNRNDHWEGLITYKLDDVDVAEVYVWYTSDGRHPIDGEVWHYYGSNGKQDSKPATIDELEVDNESYPEECYYIYCDGGDEYEVDDSTIQDLVDQQDKPMEKWYGIDIYDGDF